MKNLYNYVIWYNHFQDIWIGIPRDQYTAFFSGHMPYTGILKAKNVDTLIYMIEHPEEVAKYDNN
jgi:hypothetical protein